MLIKTTKKTKDVSFHFLKYKVKMETPIDFASNLSIMSENYGCILLSPTNSRFARLFEEREQSFLSTDNHSEKKQMEAFGSPLKLGKEFYPRQFGRERLGSFCLDMQISHTLVSEKRIVTGRNLIFNQMQENPAIFSLSALKDETNIKESPKKRPLERDGDWYCPTCNNLNFSFRLVCNRCKAEKQSKSD